MCSVFQTLLSSFAVLFVTAGGVSCAGRTSIVQREAVDPEAVAEALAGGRSAGRPHASSLAYLHYMEGMLFLQQGDAIRAETEFRQALLHDRRSTEIRVALADSQMRLGRHEQAIGNLERVLEDDPVNGGAILLIGQFGTSSGLRDRAEELLRGVLEADPENGPAVGALGSLLLASGRISEALPALETAIGRGLDDAATWECLGDARAGMEQIEAARDAYHNAIRVLRASWGVGDEREVELRRKIEDLDVDEDVPASDPISLFE